MNKTEIVKKASSAFGKVNIKLRKHSPELLIAAGVVGTVVSTVLACKATTKLSTILDESKNNIETIHKCKNDKEIVPRTTAGAYSFTILTPVCAYTIAKSFLASSWEYRSSIS